MLDIEISDHGEFSKDSKCEISDISHLEYKFSKILHDQKFPYQHVRKKIPDRKLFLILEISKIYQNCSKELYYK